MGDEELRDAEESLASPKESVRYAAVCSLATIEDETPFGLLIRALSDDSPRIRREALEILALAPERVPAVSALTEVLTSGSSEQAREAAAEGLLLLGKSAFSALTRILASGPGDARRRAAVILGDLGEGSAVPGLAAALVDSERKVRLAAAEALGKLGTEAAGKALAVASESISDLATRLLCLDTLAHLGTAPPVHVLVEAARHRALRRVALRLLAANPREEAVPVCLEGLRDSVPANRESALLGLEALRPHLNEDQEREAREILAGDDMALLRSALRSPQTAVFVAAARLAAWTGAAVLAPILARSAGEPALRGAAIEALEQLGDGAIETLRRSLESVTATERAAAVDGLALLLGKDAHSLSRQALHDPHPLVAASAARALATHGGAEDVAALVDALHRGTKVLLAAILVALRAFARREPEELARVLAQRPMGDRDEADAVVCEVLGALGGPHEILERALSDGGPRTRQAAAGALAEIGDERAIAALRAGTTQTRSDVRAAVLTALFEAEARDATAPDAELVEILRDAVADEDAQVRAAASRGLPRLGPEHAVPLLVDLVESPDESVATAALAATRQLGDTAHLADRLAVFERGVEHESPSVVRIAVLGLAEVHDPAAAVPLRLALSHPRFEVRIAAVRGLESRGETAMPALRARLREEEDPLVREVLRRALREREPGKRPPR